MQRNYILFLLFIGMAFNLNATTLKTSVSYDRLTTVSSTMSVPQDLKVEYMPENPNVTLSWYVPGTSKWLHYDNGELYTGIGLGSTDPFDVAIKYTADELAAYESMQVSQIAFVPATNGTFTLKIWSGSGNGTVIYSQECSNLTIEDWNTITLDTPVELDVTQDYYFGYTVAAANSSDYPAGCDAGPADAGKGDLVRLDGEAWISLANDAGLDYNWNVQVYVEPVTTKAVTSIVVNDTPKNTNTNHTLLSQRVKNNAVFEPIITKTKSVSPDSFNIYREGTLVNTVSTDHYTDVLTADGLYYYSVSAVYGEEESLKSDSAYAIYDTKRVQRDAVLVEDFTGTWCQYCPGAALGIEDMLAEDLNIAPIAWHNQDDYATKEASNREGFYSISGFPTVIFDGQSSMSGGSHTESLYDYYVQYYDVHYAVKTPISQEFSYTSEGTDITLHADLELVGIYPETDNLKFHTVLVENSIEESWQGLDELNTVERAMLPTESGLALTFVDNKVSYDVELSFDEEWVRENMMLVTFIQNTKTGEVLNASYQEIPNIKEIVFAVTDGTNALESATVTIDTLTASTTADGMAAFYLESNSTEMQYSVSKDGYDTATGSFTTDTTSSIAVSLIKTVGVESNAQMDVNVYPNPASGLVNISSVNTITELAIIASDGKTVETVYPMTNIAQYNVSSLVRGVYFVRVYSENNTQVIKMVVK